MTASTVSGFQAAVQNPLAKAVIEPKKSAAAKPATTKVVGFWALAHRQTKQLDGARLSAINKGLNAQWAEAASEAFNLSIQNMSDLLNVSASTLARRRRAGKALDVVASERLDRIASVCVMAEAAFADQAAAARWMATPNVALGGQKPVLHCSTDIGAAQVRRIINAIEWGGVA